jgi:hypothetical protein
VSDSQLTTTDPYRAVDELVLLRQENAMLRRTIEQLEQQIDGTERIYPFNTPNCPHCGALSILQPVFVPRRPAPWIMRLIGGASRFAQPARLRRHCPSPGKGVPGCSGHWLERLASEDALDATLALR